MEKKFKTSSRVHRLNASPSTEDYVEKALAEAVWFSQADCFRRSWFSRILGHMSAKAKKLLITTEKHEIFIMRVGTVETVIGLCEKCGAEVELLTLDSAVRVSGINGHRIVQQIANDQIHSIETANGHLLLCSRSLIENRTDQPNSGAKRRSDKFALFLLR